MTLPTRSPTEPLDSGDRVAVCVRPEQLRFVEGGFGIAGVVEIGLQLGSTIVHEIRASRRPAHQDRSSRGRAGMAPLAAGTAVRVAPLSRNAITVFRMS